MNANDMLDYALRRTEGHSGERTEREVSADPALAERLGRLSRNVHALLDDGDPAAYDPPPRLAALTIAFVHDASQKRRSVLDFVPIRLPFRLADVAVAAGVMLAGMLTLLPAVHRARDQRDQVGCASNLRHLGQALALYGARHDHYPFGPASAPDAHAGVYIAILRDDELLIERAWLDCPCNGPCPVDAPPPRLPELMALKTSDPQRYRELLCSDYAYNVGFIRDNGRVEPIDALPGRVIPLLADSPANDSGKAILPGNSPNHGGRGQNVLYSDLHVGWHNTRRVGPTGDDIFLNDDARPDPGLHDRDNVLSPALAPCPVGR